MKKKYSDFSKQLTPILNFLTLRILLVFFIFLSYTKSNAQGTTCATATSITIGGCATNDNITDTTQSLPNISGCTGTFNREGWYTFTVTGGPLKVTITAVTTDRNLFLQLISSTSSCAGLTQIACANDFAGNGGQTETISTTLNNGIYYVKVVNVGSNGNMYLASLCVTIDNDVCSGAITLTSNTLCTPTIGSTIGATDNNETGDCTINTEKAVWYQFTAVSTTHVVTVDGIAGFNPVLGVISSCGSTTIPTGGACVNATGDGGIETRTLTGLTIGQSYKIQLYDANGDLTANGFTICITHVAPTITSFDPITACAGEEVVITGTNFTGATAVNFNGVAATSFVIDSATQIKAIVPSGITTGKITVITPGGTATSTGDFTPVASNTSSTASSTPTLCINTALIAAITHTTTGAAGIGLPIDLPTGVTASWSSNVITIDGIPTDAGTFNYSIPLTGGCGSVNATGTITVKANVTTPTAIIAVGAEPTCQLTNGTTTTNYATTAANNSGFTWSLSNGAAGNIDTTTGVMTWANGFSGAVDIQVVANGCNGPTSQVVRTVTITPTVGTPTAITIAAGTEPTCQLTNGTTATTYATTATNNTGFNWSLSNSAAGSIDATTGVMTWTNGFSGTVDIRVTANGCNGPSTQVIRTVNVTANNTVGAASSAPTVCINTVLTDITHTTTAATGIDTPIDLPAGLIATWALDTITISGTPTASGTFNYSIPLLGACGSATATGTIIVENPVDPAGIFTGTATVCQGQNGVGYSVPAIANATSYTWILPFGVSIASGTNTNSITVDFSASAISGDITVYGTNNCGNGMASNYAVIVNALPDTAGSISGTATVCQGQNNVLYSVPTIANATNYNWILPSGASITSGAGTNSIYVSYDMFAVTGDITVIGTNSCGSGIISANYTVSVSITPSIISNYSSTICSGGTSTISPVDGGGNIVPLGTTYSWGLPSVTGGVTGATALSNQSSFSQILSNPTNTQQTASYNVTASTNGCSASTFSVLVYVNPKPTIDILTGPSTQPICSGASIIPVTFYNPNTISGTIDYSWTRDNTLLVTGMGTTGTGSIISGNLSNNTSSAQTTLLTAIATTDENCSSEPFSVSVLVNPNPTADVLPATQPICSGDYVTINISNPNLAGTYSYSWTSNNPSVTGTLAASGNTISGNLTNTTNTAQTILYTITASVDGCNAIIGTASVTVKPRPTVGGSLLTQTLCGGIPITSITILNPNSVAGTTFSWTRDGVTTGMANSGSGDSISGTLENFTSGNQTETFTLTAIADGCNSSISAQVIVKPKPQLTMSPASQTICSNSTFGAISVSSSNNLLGATAPFSWTRDNVSPPGFITGTSSGSGNIPNTITLTNTSNTSQTTLFTISANASNGCSNSATANVTVYAPLTTPVISASQDVCNFQSPSAFYMSTPASGGSGTYTYQWQRSNRGSGGPWTNVGTGATYNPPTSEYDYRLIVTDSYCTSKTVMSNTVYINVLGIGGILDGASLTNVPTSPICNGAVQPIGVNILHTFLSSVKFNWFSNNGYVTPGSGGPVGTSSGGFLPTTSYTFNFIAANNTNYTQSTIVTVVPAFTNGLGTCNSNAATLTLQIRPTPVVTATVPNNTICSNTSAGITLTGNILDSGNTTTFNWSVNNNAFVSGDNTSGSGSISPGGSYIISNTLVNNSTVTRDVIYTITPSSNGCSGTPITVTITVAPNVIPGAIAASQTICSGEDPAAFTETTVADGIGTLTYQWQNSTTGGSSWNNIGLATLTTYDAPGPVTQTTWYRRVVTSTYNSAVCSVDTGTPVVVTVNLINPGSITGTQTSCSPTVNPITLSSVSTPTGTGNFTYQWESSTTDCNSNFNDITLNGNSASYIVPAGLTTTTYYRRKDISTTVLPTPVKSCFAYTNCVTVFINNVTGGTIGSDQTLCGNNPAVFTEVTASTTSGTMTYQWQSNTTGCFGSWGNISGATAATYDAPAGLIATTYYRRITYSTLNSIQCSAVSNCITVTVNTVTPGTISGNRTVCHGSDPTVFTETVAATGSNLEYQWQVSTVGGAGPWTDISGATDATYDEASPINQDTYYRRVVTGTLNSTSCPVNSNFITVFVNNVTASVISGSQNVCNGIDNPSAFTITTPAMGTSVLTYQWQKSTIGCSGPWTDILSATSATYDSPAVTQTTYFHVRITSTLNGLECSAFSNCVEITSFAKLWNGSAISANTDWNNSLNWTPNGVPDATNCVVIPNVTNKPIISGINYEAHAHSISILPNSSLEITSSNNITVTDFVNVNPTANFIIHNNASLIQVNDGAINNGHITYTRTSRPMTRWGYVYWGSPIVENAFSQIPSQFDLKYRWNSGTLNGAWSALASITQGEGFITRVRNIAPFNTGLGTIDFTFNGTPGNGVVNVNVDSYDATTLTSAGNTVLLANPYPSAVDAVKFLTHPNNTELGGTLFFWTSVTLYSGTGPYNVLDYGSWNLSGGVGTSPATDPSNLGLKPNGKIVSGQGFFAQAFADGTITFDNDMRVPNFNTQFFKNGNSTTSNDSENNRIWLNLYSDTTFRQMMVNYKEGATDGYDRLYDGNSLTSNEINLYSILEDRNLVIQGKAWPFNENDIVPLGYRITNPGNYTISIDELDGIFAGNQNVFLKDKLLNSIHDIKVSPYTFFTTAGTFDNRFEIVYLSNALGTNNPSETQTFATIYDDNIRVESSELLKDISIYDISGKLITKYVLKEYKNIFSDVFNHANGVYIAKITLENGLIVTKKLIH